MNQLPNGYKKWIERVTNIVSHVFPFKWTESERRYKEWLHSKGIDEKEYLDGACEMWTLVHENLEDHIEGRFVADVRNDKWPEVEKEIKAWIEWLKELKYKKAETEVYIREENERFQGSVDLLYTDKANNVVLADWKTYGIVKKRYWLPNKFVVATDKKKKVRLQMSIYAYALAQQWINVDKLQLLFLHEEWLKIVEVDRMTKDEIESILASYKESLLPKQEIDMTKTIDLPLEVEILLPTETYGNVKVRLDLAQVDNWLTDKENIDALIKKAKYIKEQTKK